MNYFRKVNEHIQKGFRIIRQRGVRAAFQSFQVKFQAGFWRKNSSLSVKDWLSYYERQSEISQPSIHENDKFPKVSILILTYNNLLINQLCLRSIYCNTAYPNFEVIVVDNASTDETAAWLKTYSRTHSNLKLILNSDNLGFAAGNNQAAREASGEYLIFLNNDTVVTQGWIERLLAHFQNDPTVGLVGPVTNATGNEALIPVNYNSPAEMEIFASERANIMSGQSFDIRMLAFYCVMARRDQYESLGGLDERYSVGMFEDDDLAVRYHQQGSRAVCAEDVFIHHFQGASFGKLENTYYAQLFEANKQKYEEKWGKKWEPYQFRPEVTQRLQSGDLFPGKQTKKIQLNKILYGFGLFIGIAWAFFVISSYLYVDDSFLFDIIHNIGPDVLKQTIIAGMTLFLGSTLFGYAVGQNLRRKILIILTTLIIGAAAFQIIEPVIQSSLFILNKVNDGLRASIFIGIAAILGIGIGLGVRINRHPLTIRSLTILFSFPFLLVTLHAGAIADFLALAWLFLLADALGISVLSWVNRYTKVPSKNINRSGLLSIAVGLAILILGIFILGLVGAVSTFGILFSMLLVTIFFLPQMKSSLMRLINLPWNQSVLMSPFEMGALLMLVAVFTIYWIGALAPEVGADALGFRIAGPVIWLREGMIRPLPEMLGSYGQFAGEMMYLLMMPLTGFSSAKIVQFGLAILLVVSSYFQVFEKRYRKQAALLLFAFWGSTLVWWQMIWGFVDLSQLFFYFACILALRFWLDETESPLWLIVAGIAGATATTIKLNGAGALVIASLVVLGVSLYHTHSLTRTIKNGLYLGMTAVLFLFPWLIRSYLLTKNPLFPFANQIFKSPLIVSMPVASFGVGMSFPAVLSVPWGVFFDPAQFGSMGTYHPLTLACAVLGAIGMVWVSSRKDWLWFGAGTLAYIFWLVTEQNLRYSLFAICFLMLAFSIGLLKWQDRFSGRFPRGIFQSLLLIGLVWGFGMQALRPSFWMKNAVSGTAFPTQVVFGTQTSSDYLTSFVPTYYCAEWLNHHYGQNAKVWQMTHRDHLYFEAPVYNNIHGILSVTQPLNEILVNNGDFVTIYQSLAAEGYTHILYSPPQMSNISAIEAERQGILNPKFEDAFLKLECADRGLRLYKIRPTPLNVTTLPDSGPNLIANGGFETLDQDKKPIDWDLNDQVKAFRSDGNMVLRLNDGATLSQTVIVSEDSMYELTAELRTSNSEQAATIETVWFDSSGKLHLIYREQVHPIVDFASFRFLQTAPPGVQTVVVYVHGGGDVDVDNIRFREIHR